MAKTKTSVRKAEQHTGEHIRDNTSKQRTIKIDCPECKFSTVYLRNYHRHRVRHHGHSTYQCDKCEASFETAVERTRHKVAKHPNENFSKKYCPICEYSTHYYSDLARHRNKHRVAQYHCMVCNYPFCNDILLRSHMQKTHADYWSRHRLHDHAKSEDLKYFGRGIDKLPLSKKDIKKGALVVLKQRENEILKHDIETIKKPTNRSNNNMNNLRTPKTSTAPSDNVEAISTNSEQRKTNTGNEFTNSKYDTYIFTCDKCPYETSSEDNFKLHIQRHKRSRFNCHYCKMPFKFKISFDKHLKRCNFKKHLENADSLKSGGTMKCNLCSYETKSFKFFTLHLDLHDPPEYEQSDEAEMVQSPEPFDYGQDTIESHENDAHTDMMSPENSKTEGHSISLETSFVKGNRKTLRCESNGSCNSSMSSFSVPTASNSSESTGINGRETVDTSPNNNVVRSSSSHRFMMLTEDLELSESADSDTSNKDSTEHVSLVSSSTGFVSPVSVINDDGRHCEEDEDSEDAETYGNRGVSMKSCDLLEEGELPEYMDTDVEYEEMRDNEEEFDENENDDDMETSTVTRKVEAFTVNNVRLDNNTNILSGTYDNSVSPISAQSSRSGVISTMLGFEELLGALSKEKFERHKRFYKKKKRHGNSLYTCLLCDSENIFKSNNDICGHFESCHGQLRQRICAACEFCCKPFPKRK